MTNKDYKPLTTGGYTNSKMLQEYRDRLCYLEDCIKNDKLVFLPRIGQTVWIVIGGWYENEYYTEVSEEVINEIHIYEDYEVRISVEDGHGDIFSHYEWYTTEEEAKEYAEKLKQVRGVRWKIKTTSD